MGTRAKGSAEPNVLELSVMRGTLSFVRLHLVISLFRLCQVVSWEAMVQR